MSKKSDQPLVSVKWCADELGVDPRTVRRYVQDGLLVAVRVGPRLIRIERESLEALMRPVGGAR